MLNLASAVIIGTNLHSIYQETRTSVCLLMVWTCKLNTHRQHLKKNTYEKSILLVKLLWKGDGLILFRGHLHSLLFQIARDTFSSR